MSLSKEQYDLLCKTSDKIMLDDRLTKVTLAISWLHIIKWHPEYLKQYKTLFNKINIFSKFTTYVFRIGYYTFSFIHSLAKSLFVKNYWTSSHKDINQVDIIFFSHLVNPNEYGRDEDFYYGNIHNMLRKKGISSVIVKIDHINCKKNLIQHWKKFDTPRIVLHRTLSFMEELKIFTSQILERSKILKVKNSCNGFEKKLVNELSFRVLSPDTVFNIRKSVQVKKILTILNPKCIITTFEGFAWERMVYSEARQYDASIKRIGYQHAAIFKFQHSIKKIYNDEKYNPDWVLSSGKISRNRLNVLFAESNVNIGILGSLKSSQIIRNFRKTVCLVTPETFKGEKRSLFDFSLEFARKNPSIFFIWRLHPKTNFKDLHLINPEYKNLPDNITLSNNSLDSDLKKTSFILYRGSTVVVNAMSCGIIPIYLKKNMNELTIDPIYDQMKGKSVITSQSEFYDAIYKSYSLNEINSLKKYGQLFYTPIDLSTLKEIIVHN
jgi:hypothetical protein